MTQIQILELLNNAVTSGSFKKTQKQIAVNVLPGVLLSITFEKVDVDHKLVATVVNNLCQVSKSSRSQISQQLYDACLQSFSECSCDFKTPQAQLDWEAKSTGTFVAPRQPKSANEIWTLVKFDNIFVRRAHHGPNKGKPVAIISGECAWDGEHGVALHYLNGTTLVHVGNVND